LCCGHSRVRIAKALAMSPAMTRKAHIRYLMCPILPIGSPMTNSFSIIGVSFELKEEVWVGFLLFLKSIHLSIDMKASVQELNARRNNPRSQEESNADQARRDRFRKRIYKAVGECICRLRYGTYVVLKELHAKGTAAECQVWTGDMEFTLCLGCECSCAFAPTTWHTHTYTRT
jgi:hypothetical protein